jgi:hypothetical protein
MCSGESTRALPRVGFPIRKSRDQRLVSTSSGLIAATHVLHRLSAPRHPPRALILLIEKNTFCCRYGVFKVRAGRRPRDDRLKKDGLSKLSSMAFTSRSTWCFLEKLPRKEVIQPQLPLRLPCYDFTPVTDPTFDGSLPCGLGHRLRVLPASVV